MVTAFELMLNISDAGIIGVVVLLSFLQLLKRRNNSPIEMIETFHICSDFLMY